MASKQYKKLDSISHIHKRPDMYIGTNKTRETENEILCNENWEMKHYDFVSINDGFLRIFLEALSNAIDNFYRSLESKIPMTKIMIDVCSETGKTSIYNDGLHIPVEMHTEENIYIPELIFGHLLSGSNYDDTEERQTSGRNGLGIKLLNVFSELFEIEIVDPIQHLCYKQKWSNHMKKCSIPKIRELKGDKKKGYTKISWVPDFSLFLDKDGEPMTQYNETLVSLYRKHVMDAAMITKLPIYWNEKKIQLKKLSSYVDLYLPLEGKISYVEGSCANMDYVICENFMGQSCISFVNGIPTRDGGIHQDKFFNEFLKIICQRLSKLKIQPKDIKQYFTVFLNVTVTNPEFSSQSKTKMVACKNALHCEFSNRVINPILKWNFISEVQEMNRLKDMLTLKKSEKKRGFRKIDGLDPANYAGTKKSKDCVLILCEGLSAKTYSTHGISKGFDNKKGRNYFGIYPLRGKLLNVRNASLTSISGNKEINDVIQALNLKFDTDYRLEKNFETLQYGKVCIITDADEDGHHICSLLLNMFHKLFPTLLLRQTPFLSIMLTPIAKILHGKNVDTFYNDHDYQLALEIAEQQKKKFEVKYYKGLGTSSDKEIMESFGEKIVSFLADSTTDEYMNRIFHKNFSGERKDWLLQYNPAAYRVPTVEYPITTYFNQDLIKYSLEDCKRSIPNLYDGLKVSQRKILYSVFKKRLNPDGKSMKVAQLAGYCAEHSNYHHGEQCLYETIIKMTHHFPGSNNIPYFERDGQFGTRLHGGKDAANARYIFTKLAPLTRLLFPEEDDVLLSYTLDDGDKVQPDYYLPILPTMLLNGCTAGIGTGWSCFTPCFQFEILLQKVREFLDGNGKEFELYPHYFKYGGEIQKISESKYKTVGKLNGFIEKKKQYYEITELPIGIWTDKYKEELENMQENKKIKGLKNYSTPDKIHFVFEPTTHEISIDSMKLSSVLNLTNMVLFTDRDKIQKFATIYQIFCQFFEQRLALYEKRIQHQLEQLEYELQILQNKSRFILEVVEKTIDIFNMEDDGLIHILEAKEYFKEQDSFDYLLRIPIRDLTKNKYSSLQEKMQNIESDIVKLRKKTSKDVWLDDLKKLEKKYYQLYK